MEKKCEMVWNMKEARGIVKRMEEIKWAFLLLCAIRAISLNKPRQTQKLYTLDEMRCKPTFTSIFHPLFLHHLSQ